MVTVNIREAKAQLSKLVDQAVKGEAFVIAKAGKPLVKVAALDAPARPQRLGFLAGEIAVPEDFNRMGEAEIAAMFGSGSPGLRVLSPGDLLKEI
jgi:prevent-host-death family protein